MWCVCQNKTTGELSIMARPERETMLSVLLDLGAGVETRVIAEWPTKEEAEKYVSDFIRATDIIDNALF